MNGYNNNIKQEQINKLKQLFPKAVTEGKIDWQKLQVTLGEAVDLGECYGLGWKGKSDVFATIQEKAVQTLHPDRTSSVDWDVKGNCNMFIKNDNLTILKVLHEAYYGKVKMIYIDPPYNTGNDFIYNDDFKQTRHSYEAEAGITDDEGSVVVRDDGLRTNTGGHKHSNWLNMMYPRLFLARNLLHQNDCNHCWICVQLPELADGKSEAYKADHYTIADIARERVRWAGVKIRADQADKLTSRNIPLDLGFRAYRVGDSNFKQWNELVSNPEEIRQQALANLDPLEEGTTNDDLLTELLLKRNPSSIILLDQSFGGDVNLKVNIFLQAERQSIDVGVV